LKRLITASLSVTTLVVAFSSIASADPAAPATTPAIPPAVTSVTAPVAKEMRDESRAAISRVAMPPVDKSGIDLFRPDYSHALTPDQMDAAWKAEIDRIFETPITGGG
jgi:hypothetical protein